MREWVTDTHGFLWHLYLPTRLGPGARRAFEEADSGRSRIYIPAVVAAEALMIAEKGRIPGVDLDRLVPHLSAARLSDNYTLSDLAVETVLSSHSLPAIPDIFDRLIVAEALARKLPLISRDPVIREAGLVSTVWS